jgi:threonine synthase
VALRDEEGFDFADVLPKEFVGMDQREKRVRKVDPGTGIEGIRQIISEEVRREKEGA